MRRSRAFALALVALLLSSGAQAARIKDLARFAGVRPNPLIGYGIVVGLQGTGDSSASLFANRSLAGLLSKLGIVVDPNLVKVTNVAAVMVTAELPPFARIGETLDVTISSIGDSSNLQGGTLLATPLLGVNGEVYALAQGGVSIGGFSASSGAGDAVQQNHPTVGRIPGGALVERELPFRLRPRDSMRLLLREKDFTTAARMARELNAALGSGIAHASDAGTIELRVPEPQQLDLVTFLARVEDVQVQPDRSATVVLNERTGTVVMGADVRISAVAIAHGNLTVRIDNKTQVSQPAPFAQVGSTVAFDNAEIVVQEKGTPLAVVQGITISELVRALNAIGASPRDLIAILQAIKAAGALQAELKIL
ncbi:MAG: flagellar basal body P-ring protein FlgI [Myxococcota bacterium]